MSERTSIPSISLGKITRDELERLRSMRWTEADRTSMSLESLPVHLQSRVFIISSHGNRNWESQAGVNIPGNSVIRLYNANGTIEMGWNRLVTPSGRFADNGEILGPSDSEFTAAGYNRFCMLVSTPKVIFKNNGVPNWGASVGDAFWSVGANDGGICEVAFNDNDNNNTGTFTQYLEVREASAFAEWVANLAQ